jgi:hypothetical protein
MARNGRAVLRNVKRLIIKLTRVCIPIGAHLEPSSCPTKRATSQTTASTMDKPETPQTSDREHPVTLHPVLAPQSHLSSQIPHPIRTSASPFSIIQRPQSSPTQLDSSPVSLSDLMPHLHRSAPSIVKTRSGSVLSRGFILKTDHYPSGELSIGLSAPSTHTHTGRALDLDLNIHGAPNFRAPRIGSLNVFGAAQPRSQGLRAILSILRARPKETSPSHVIWFSTREEPIGILCLLLHCPLNFPYVSLGN